MAADPEHRHVRLPIALAFLVLAAAAGSASAAEPGERVASGWSGLIDVGAVFYRDDADGFTFESNGPRIAGVLAHHFGADWYAHMRLGLAVATNQDSSLLFSGETRALGAEALLGRRVGPVWIGGTASASASSSDLDFFDATERVDSFAVGLAAAGFAAESLRLSAQVGHDWTGRSYDPALFADDSRSAWTASGEAQVFITDDLAFSAGLTAAFSDGETRTTAGGEVEFKLPDRSLGVYAGASYRWISREAGGDFSSQTVFGGIRLFLDEGSLKDVYRDELPFL
jgi:hypothetical protein